MARQLSSKQAAVAKQRLLDLITIRLNSANDEVAQVSMVNRLRELGSVEQLVQQHIRSKFVLRNELPRLAVFVQQAQAYDPWEITNQARDAGFSVATLLCMW